MGLRLMHDMFEDEPVSDKSFLFASLAVKLYT